MYFPPKVNGMPPKRTLSSASSSSSSSSSSFGSSGVLQSRGAADATDPHATLIPKELMSMVGLPDLAASVGLGQAARGGAGPAPSQGFASGGEYSTTLHIVGVGGNRSCGVTEKNEYVGEGEGDDGDGDSTTDHAILEKKKRKPRVKELETLTECTLSTKLLTLSRISFSPALLHLGAPSVAATLANKLWVLLKDKDPFADEAKLTLESASLFRDCLDGRSMTFTAFWNKEGAYTGAKPYVYRLFRDKRISVMQIIVRCCDSSNACHLC